MRLDAYRAEAEEFVSSLDREYYRHYSGLQASYEIEPIYERHATLFERAAVDGLREAGSSELLRFAAEGFVDQGIKAEVAEVARREAALEVEVDGGRLPFRQAALAQANEPDPDRRAALEHARLDLVERELNPLLEQALERSHALARELGWESLAAMCEELSGIDLSSLAGQTAAFLAATDEVYEAIVGPELERQLGLSLAELRRSDLPAFFRSPRLDELFPADRLLATLERLRRELGLDSASRGRIVLDVEPRPSKSPRAFCAPVRVPDEVYLVLAPVGGREDYETLLHEAGHAEHYAAVDPALPFEHRYLGDNSLTEGFAFLFEGLIASPEWLARTAVRRPEAVVAFSRASKLVYLRRYAAKLAYELALHGGDRPGDGLRARYSRALSDALRVDWPGASWLIDVDSYFYAARYLRAWALETHLRRVLHERHGESWFSDREAGALLRSLWRDGQRLRADELLTELTGAPLDFSAVLGDFAPAGATGPP